MALEIFTKNTNFQIRQSVTQLDITPVEVLHLKGDFLGALIKLIYAFVWQEWVITSDPRVFDPDVNAAGNAAIPAVNAFANSLNNFPIYDQDLQVI